MPELEEVRADDNLLIYNKIQYTYQALPNAKKVKVYVKANDKDAKGTKSEISIGHCMRMNRITI